ncbi:hypothetical protein Bca4012_103028 [Brassica carinata]
MCASQRVSKPVRRKEADWLILTVHSRPTLIFREGFECEHTCRDPKDGELCLSGRPEETLVEARSDTDANRSPDLGRTGGCFVEPSHGIESSKWAIFGKRIWRCGMNRSRSILRVGETSPDSALCANFKGDPLKFRTGRAVDGNVRESETPGGIRKSYLFCLTACPLLKRLSRRQGKSAKWIRNFGKGLARGLGSGSQFQPADCWRLLEPLTWRATASCRPGTDWERLFRAFRRRTANSELCSECQSEEIQPSAVNGGVTMTLLSQGNGLGRISGKEDPVELDSSPTL